MQFATNKFLSITCAFLSIFLLSFNCLSEDIKKAKFAYFGNAESDYFLGVKQSISEANRQGRFLGQGYEIDSFDDNIPDNFEPAAYIAIITDTTNSDFLIELANNYPTHPIFNLALTDTSLRSACHTNLLNILPSNAMKKDAMAQWAKKSPDTPAKAQAWHKDFKKYAARDLNKRFLKNV